jgi:hypothetical protein
MGFKTGNHGKVYNDDKKSHGPGSDSPNNNDGSKDSSRDDIDTSYQGYPDEFSLEDFDDYFSSKNVLIYVDDDEDKMDDVEMSKVIEDSKERSKWVMEYAKKHNAQIYTYVDLDSGETGYSKGIRYANRIDQGNYVVVRKSDLKVDNS